MQPIRQQASTTVTAFLAVLCLTPALAASDSEIHGVVTDNAGNRSAGPLSKLPWMRRVFTGTPRTTTQRRSAKQTSACHRESTSLVSAERIGKVCCQTIGTPVSSDRPVLVHCV